MNQFHGKLFSDTTEKKMEDLVFLGEKKYIKRQIMMSKFFILIFATCIHQFHEKITKTHTETTTRKFISDNNLNKKQPRNLLIV